jgi:hypothetical protein
MHGVLAVLMGAMAGTGEGSYAVILEDFIIDTNIAQFVADRPPL